MTIQQLDFYFPFFVFLYGVMVSIPLCSQALMDIAEKKLPEKMLAQLKTHRRLAMLCVYVGGIWSLQNIVI